MLSRINIAIAGNSSHNPEMHLHFERSGATVRTWRAFAVGLFIATSITGSGWAAPVIDPVGSVTIPAGKSLILPITATSTAGPLSYTVSSSTNRIAAILHTNDPFWQLSVAQVADPSAPAAYQTPFRGGTATVTNIGTLTFMLFPEYAPHTVNVFQGLTASGFFNSNTIFHRVVTNALIQGGDPLTNGSGGLVFTFDDEYNPQAIFSGSGQLALANSQKNANGSQFFVTCGAQRSFDLAYPLFGQLVRGFDVLTNVVDTPVDGNDRPLTEVVIEQANYVSDPTDTVLTLTAAKVVGVNGTITIVAADSAGARATNTFAVTTVTDTNSNNQPIIYPNAVTKQVGPKNSTLTNYIGALELDGDELYWFPQFANQTSADGAPDSSYNLYASVFKNLTYDVTNPQGRFELFLKPATGYVGPVSVYFNVSYSSEWSVYEQYGFSLPNYDQQIYTFVFGDTTIAGQSNQVAALAAVPFTNALLATFTNGVPGSAGTNFTAFINWGDDTTNSGTVTMNAAGIKGVLGSHTYAYPGNYPVYVQVQSSIGASATILSYVNVTNQAAPSTSPLTVLVAGQGTVSPLYTNTQLAVGGSYSIGATPTNGWFLLSWTDAQGFVLGTGTNLTFTMSPGLMLTANFALIAPPTLTIASPSASHVVTNLYSAPATIIGTAADNATVAAVWYQVNSGGWQAASGTTSWSANFTPEYGVTNVFQAYAVNDFGYVSGTNVMYMKYLAGDILQVETNGRGSITPTLNGELLPLGTNYTLTATPGAGFVFTNWTVSTNWLGGSITNHATVQFTMATNLTLQANFTEVARPTNTITAPVNGQHLPMPLATITGAAKDLVAVSNVFYSLNNSGWSNAVTANNWSTWTAQVTLTPGTNTVAAYAVGASGNVSKTNTVSLVYVVSAVLTVNVGLGGTVVTNYNGDWLPIGQTNSMTAKTNVGFAFSGWTGSITTNSPKLTFIVASNLVFTASFADVGRPTNAITAPVANQHLSSPVFTATGKAGDNVAVSNVFYSLNDGGWSNAVTANNWSNWTAQVTLTPGTNTLAAYAVDTSGNVSKTNTASFEYVVSAVLTVNVGFGGTVVTNYNGEWLPIGQTNSMTAKTNVGFAFGGWTGSITTNSPKLTFIVASNLVFNANFTDIARPTNAIAAPAANQHLSNAVFTVTGKAGDNVAVSNVFYSLDNSGWSNAVTANKWTNWTAQVTLTPGTNTVAAYAVDTSGNVSKTNTVSFVYVVSVVAANNVSPAAPGTFKLKLQIATGQPLTGDGLAFSLLLSTNLNGRIQVSTNLYHWVDLTNFIGTNSALNLLDPAATNSSARYYRAVIP